MHNFRADALIRENLQQQRVRQTAGDKVDALHAFLQYVVAFDSVDDESKPENPLFDSDVTTPGATPAAAARPFMVVQA